MNTEVRALFAKVAHETFFRELGPGLHIGEAHDSELLDDADLDLAGARSSLLRSGFFQVPGVASCDRVKKIATVLEALHREGIPSPFLFVYDETWTLVESALRQVRRMMNDNYGLLPDVWAWFIPKETGASGWRVHRGTYENNLRDGQPSTLNLWLALSDVSVENACMHVLPIEKDPNFRGDLHSIGFEPHDPLPLPAATGTLLGWNSNVLHWGGAMTERATAPRMSLSFSVRAPAEDGDIKNGLALSFDARKDLIADMIDTYCDYEGNALDAGREWSRLTKTMRTLGR